MFTYVLYGSAFGLLGRLLLNLPVILIIGYLVEYSIPRHDIDRIYLSVETL